MSEFKSQYDRQKQSAENTHYYELSLYLQQLKTAPFQLRIGAVLILIKTSEVVYLLLYTTSEVYTFF